MISRSNRSARRVTLGAAAFEGAIGLAGLALASRLERPAWDQLQGRPWDVGVGLLAAVPLVAGFWMAMRRPLGPLRELRELTRRVVAALFRDCAAYELLLIAVMAGLGEELFFRGFLQQWLIERAGVWVGLAVASLAFGALHLLSITYAALATLVGAFLGWLCLASGNLVAAITAHAVYDFIALWWLVRQIGADSDERP